MISEVVILFFGVDLNFFQIGGVREGNKWRMVNMGEESDGVNRLAL